VSVRRKNMDAFFTWVVLMAFLLIMYATSQSYRRSSRMMYCPFCTAPLVHRDIAGRSRLACSRCNFVYWDNPKPVAVTLVPKDGGLVLVKRKLPPRDGFWALPGGFIEAYESPADAAVREVLEETGLKVEIDHLIEAIAPAKRANEILLFFVAKPTTDEPTAGDDAAEVRVFKREDLPEIAFDSHERIIREWFARQDAEHGAGT
jgi:ADP-ribose pyrophosphatase YjhB (NUDIX family)